jgi:membrane-associated protease RseP (regulator of RpoE activity)
MIKKIPYLHIILFILTFFSTLTAGALQKGINILKEPAKIIEGLPFSGTLMTILLFHELSHYIASKRHHTKATLPYFIPAPSLIGTFGAFIKMKSPIITRKALIDIGASGPIAGFIVSVVASFIGLNMSEIVHTKNIEGAIKLGDSILFSFISKLVIGVPPEGHDILLHPVAFAGWIGLFVTSLNLIPIGQLDGGHIAFALLGNKHKYLSIFLVITLAFLGIFYWEGWALWAVLMLILGIKHPPILYWEFPINSKRRFIGFISLLIFIVTFIPEPFKIT